MADSAIMAQLLSDTVLSIETQLATVECGFGTLAVSIGERIFAKMSGNN